ncbi:MAG: hypothetical protein PHI90_00325 [Clostridia bacterium]|nr:hypothetical protein [Clostridia bacterium]MDD4047274.1 hypothetical protein [Clostridia bacterium]
MSLTSPSVANKNNLFHVGSSITLLVIVQEYVVFNILQHVNLQIPAYPLQSKDLTEVNTHLDIATNNALNSLQFQSTTQQYIDTINVKKVLDSVYQVTEKYFYSTIPTKQVKNISCTITNITVQDILTPFSSEHHALAMAIYHYNVNISYINPMGNTTTITIASGTRHQQAIVYAPTGYLDTNLAINCTNFNHLVNSKHTTCTTSEITPTYKANQLWLTTTFPLKVNS